LNDFGVLCSTSLMAGASQALPYAAPQALLYDAGQMVRAIDKRETPTLPHGD
jgi:hypothetical protein